MKQRVFALIPAAGKSVRMGRPKLALPLGDLTVLERVLAALQGAHLADMVVVLGPHGADLQRAALIAGANVLVLPTETPEMRATIEHGLAWLEERYRPGPGDAFLLCPADHPTLDGAVVAALMAEASAKPQAANILVPTFEGRRGHPALVAWKHVEGIRALPPDQGLNGYFREHAESVLEMPWQSPDILFDLDTPADYERLRARFEPA